MKFSLFYKVKAGEGDERLLLIAAEYICDEIEICDDFCQMSTEFYKAEFHFKIFALIKKRQTRSE
jgi:hypothetical protein